MVKGANATILLTCTTSLVLSSLIAYVGCRSLPRCACYDARTGLVGKNTTTTLKRMCGGVISTVTSQQDSSDLPVCVCLCGVYSFSLCQE